MGDGAVVWGDDRGSNIHVQEPEEGVLQQSGEVARQRRGRWMEACDVGVEVMVERGGDGCV